MIELKLKRTALRWDFSFFAALAVFFLWDASGFGIAALGICAVHELGHLAVMRLCGIIPESMTFYGAGIRLSAPEVERRSVGVRIAVYSAGCAVNFLISAACLALGNANLAAVSLAAGLFNLLPVGEFDGKRLLKIALLYLLPPENVDRALSVCGIFSAVVCAALVFSARGADPTFFITAGYLLVLSASEL